MIKQNRCSIEVNGTKAELLADYSSITNSLYKHFSEVYGGEMAKSELKMAFDLGLKSEEELDKELENIKQEALRKLNESNNPLTGFLKKMIEEL